MTSELKIQTPEGIVFSYTLAGPITRCLAWLIDWMVTVALVVAFAYGLNTIGLIFADIARALTMAGYFVITIGYGIVFEAGWRGQTIGKRVMRLRVMDVHGMRLQFHQVVLRNLLRAVDMLPFLYLLGGVTCLIGRRAQRIGDLVAGTVVVHSPIHTEPDMEQLLGVKYNSLRDHPHLTARLRQRVTPQTAQLALEALVRREVLEPGARVELFRDLAGYFDHLVAFPPEVRELLPDEQYVRNVADVLFRTNGSSTAASKLSSAAVAQN